MRNKFINVVYSLLFVAGWLIVWILYKNNLELEHQINQRDRLISNTKLRDSLFTKETKRYSDTITKYVSDCKFIINGKTVSTAELLKFVNNKLLENAQFQDSINLKTRLLENSNKGADFYKRYIDSCLYEKSMLRDSVHIFKTMLRFIRRDYGISYTVSEDSVRAGTSFHSYEKGFSKADSGLLLLPYFRDKIKRDPNTNSWIITTR